MTFISFIFCSVINAYDFPGPGEWFLSRGYFVMTFCKQPFFFSSFMRIKTVMMDEERRKTEGRRNEGGLTEGREIRRNRRISDNREQPSITSRPFRVDRTWAKKAKRREHSIIIMLPRHS